MHKIIHNVMNDDFNEMLTEDLTTVNRWTIITDWDLYPENNLAEPEKFSDSGLSIKSYDHGGTIGDGSFDPVFTRLNAIGKPIFDAIIEKSDIIKPVQLLRLQWNYYNAGSTGNTHVDTEQDGIQSIVYNINTNNGGTVIDGEFIKSVAGDAIIFPSNVPHHGVGPGQAEMRFMLNIMFYVEGDL